MVEEKIYCKYSESIGDTRDRDIWESLKWTWPWARHLRGRGRREVGARRAKGKQKQNKTNKDASKQNVPII